MPDKAEDAFVVEGKARLFMLASPESEISFDDEFKLIFDELTGSFQ
jgi:hypothetical protein